tara:strand:- start:973 stop:2715 length:1743 start_codon:yes stop_codon:yes gene_type:complete
MSLFQTDEILSKFKLFWQYPVITEKTFYQQNKDNETYIGFPWATIIDKKYDLNVIFKLMNSYIRPNVQYYTCCQHISFRNLIPLFKALNIHTIYTPHKILTEDQLNDIQLRPCPLYAVNIEDNNRNLTFSKCDPLNLNRKLLYSFQGAYHPSWYLTDIRKRIFEMKHPDNCYVNHIGNWHFDNVVYNKLQNSEYALNETDDDNARTIKYNKLLLDSRYSLCPSGSGPNSIRFWESLAVGSIPVLLADTLELPSHELWDDSIVRIPENKLEELPSILSSISEEKEREMRVNCIKLYEYYKNNYTNKKSKNMVVFSNCHGERYIDIFKRDTNIHNVFNINYIVSYQQLDNFSNFKGDFIKADVLIINNIKQYNDYTMGNLKQILKPSCMVIVIPFVRFEGYWMPEQYKQLKYVSGNAVSFFPNIEKNNIKSYLLGDNDNNNEIITYFKKCLAKLKQIDQESDIRFYDFFVDNHDKFPFFRDNYHPTMNILEYIATQIIEKIDQCFDITYNKSNFNLKQDLFEWGHYKPIRNSVKRALKLEYDLDKVFLCNREKYLNVILDNETKQHKIVDLDDLRSKYFRTV